jgi:hypothetical protein
MVFCEMCDTRIPYESQMELFSIAAAWFVCPFCYIDNRDDEAFRTYTDLVEIGRRLAQGRDAS